MRKELEQQLSYLLETHESVFVIHYKDGRIVLSGDKDNNKDEMEVFFKLYPNKEVDKIEFLK